MCRAGGGWITLNGVNCPNRIPAIASCKVYEEDIHYGHLLGYREVVMYGFQRVPRIRNQEDTEAFHHIHARARN
ncbi:hypothetical protein ZHAS_00008967 [Anopheles sinensis]|uniref:Uncharacterized protein n=1 Tax=Anopheles sinensis TaxID=74873 RepID=A0A084VTT4_ANOSI|nr:hypothetical protein ZHAS_00008967 [Anopheles sinensis]